MPIYYFQCQMCSTTFIDQKNYLDNGAECPNCEARGDETFPNPEYGNRDMPKVCRVWMNAPAMPKGLSLANGGQGLDYSHVFGEQGKMIASERELKDYLKLTRDKYFAQTNGVKSVMRPVKNERTGEVTMEKFSHEQQGVDLGEMHIVEENRGYNEVMSAFDSSVPGGKDNETLADAQKRLQKVVSG